MNELEQALEIMQRRGRTRGHLITDDGRVCSWGAVLLAVGYDEEDLREADVMTPHRMSQVPVLAFLADAMMPDRQADGLSPAMAIVTFNDPVYRTDEEVFEKFREAAKELANRSVT